MNNEVHRETLKQRTMVVTQENNSIVQLIHRICSFRKLIRIFGYAKKFFQKAKQQSQKTFASRTDPTQSGTKCYSQRRNLSPKRGLQKSLEAAIASDFQSLCQLSSSDLYHEWIALYSLIRKLYLQEFDAIVSQSSSSMTEGKSTKNSQNACCHTIIGKVELSNVIEAEVCKVEVGRVEVGNIKEGKVGKVKVGKICKLQVGKLGTVQVGNLDKLTS